MSILSQLREDPWFGSIPLELSKMIFEQCSPVMLSDGERIYERGDSSDGMYGVVHGSVRIVQLSSTGTSGIHDIKQAPSWFGELSEIDGKKRPQDATAIGKVKLLHLSRKSFRKLVAIDPNHWEHFAKLLAQHVRELCERVESLATRPARIRLAQLLMNTFVIQRRASLASEPPPITQDTLASIVGVSRQAASRILKEFEQRGAISLSYRRIDVIDVAKLKAVSRIR